MTDDERDEVRRQGLLRALALVQRYQDEHWRRLRVNDICTDIKRLIKDEAARLTPVLPNNEAAHANRRR